MRNKSILLRILAAAVALTLIVFLLIFANGLIGNPVSRFLANQAARKYVNAKYPELNLKLDKANYDFKSGRYYVHAKSTSSIDTHFTIHLSATGKIGRDDFEHRVLKKSNTFERINNSYHNQVKALFDSDKFPYKTDIDFGNLQTYYENLPYGSIYGIKHEELELDQEYDVMELGKEAGQLTLYVEDGDLTIERAAAIMLDIRKIFDEHDITFYAMNFNLQEARTEEKPSEIRVHVSDFLYEDIYADGMVERVAKAHDDLTRYYEEQDAKTKERESIEKKTREQKAAGLPAA